MFDHLGSGFARFLARSQRVLVGIDKHGVRGRVDFGKLRHCRLVKNGSVAPAVIMAAIRPKLRRENPRLIRSLFSSSFRMFIGPLKCAIGGRLAVSGGGVQ